LRETKKRVKARTWKRSETSPSQYYYYSFGFWNI
jgi:hypothetical protein